MHLDSATTNNLHSKRVLFYSALWKKFFQKNLLLKRTRPGSYDYRLHATDLCVLLIAICLQAIIKFIKVIIFHCRLIAVIERDALKNCFGDFLLTGHHRNRQSGFFSLVNTYEEQQFLESRNSVTSFVIYGCDMNEKQVPIKRKNFILCALQLFYGSQKIIIIFRKILRQEFQ
jgi:hypothetical protein